MTEPHLVGKKLAFIETCVRELRDLVRPDEILTDLRAERFAEHTLQLAIRAALDVASHVVSDERLGEPGSNKEPFTLVVRGGCLPEAMLPTRVAMSRRTPKRRTAVPRSGRGRGSHPKPVRARNR